MYIWVYTCPPGSGSETNFKQIFPFGFTPLYMFILRGDLSRRQKTHTHTIGICTRARRAPLLYLCGVHSLFSAPPRPSPRGGEGTTSSFLRHRDKYYCCRHHYYRYHYTTRQKTDNARGDARRYIGGGRRRKKRRCAQNEFIGSLVP